MRCPLLLFLSLLAAGPLAAQYSFQPSDQSPARTFAELDSAASASPRVRVWGRSLYGPMLLVGPRTRRVFSNQPFPGGVLQPVGAGAAFQPAGGAAAGGSPGASTPGGGTAAAFDPARSAGPGSAPWVPVYEGTLPDSVGLANTSVVWGGRGWSMVLLPVFAQQSLRLNLLFHESFHRIQDSLGLPAQSPTAGFLDTQEGRVWFRLELRALVSALSKPVDARADDLRHALVFRSLRFALHPGEDSIEHALEWNEGLAEFTGTYASGADLDTAYLPGIVRADTLRPSFTRSFAYFTGPLYGILLSQKDKDWPRQITAGDNFEGVLRRVYGLAPGRTTAGAAALHPSGTAATTATPPTSAAALRAEAHRLAPAYDGAAIVAQEAAREAKRHAKELAYRQRLVQGPVLVLTVHGHMHVGFNPNNLFDLGSEGTVYPNMTMSDDWGTLDVTAGALFKDWHMVRVALDDTAGAGIATVDAGTTTVNTRATAANAGVTRIKTPGWSLTLNPGWTLVAGPRKGDLMVVSR